MPGWAQSAIGTYGYAAVFLIVLVEGLGVPVPGETALLVAGALAGAGQLNIAWVIVVAAIAAITGDSGGYYIGRRWGRRLLERYGSRVGLTEERRRQIDRFFERFGLWALFIGRFEAVLRTYVGIFAGMARMRFLPFLVVRGAACIVWALVFGLLAYFLGRHWSLLSSVVHNFGLASIAVGIVALVVAIVLVRRQG